MLRLLLLVLIAVPVAGAATDGVLVDSRGARRCSGLRGILGDLLGVGYP